MKERQAPHEAVLCPFCNSIDTEMIALFGMRMMTCQYYCRHCHSAFEAVKWTTQEPNTDTVNRADD